MQNDTSPFYWAMEPSLRLATLPATPLTSFAILAGALIGIFLLFIPRKDESYIPVSKETLRILQLQEQERQS